jgi:hypothetical protein
MESLSMEMNMRMKIITTKMSMMRSIMERKEFSQQQTLRALL